MLTSGKLRLPKIGDVPVRWSRPPPAGLGPGFGGSVDVETIDPWNVPGRYGWVGGTGTAAHITASTGTITILLSQPQMPGTDPARSDARLLAARGERLKPGTGG